MEMPSEEGEELCGPTQPLLALPEPGQSHLLQGDFLGSCNLPVDPYSQFCRQGSPGGQGSGSRMLNALLCQVPVHTCPFTCSRRAPERRHCSFPLQRRTLGNLLRATACKWQSSHLNPGLPDAKPTASPSPFLDQPLWPHLILHFSL